MCIAQQFMLLCCIFTISLISIFDGIAAIFICTMLLLKIRADSILYWIIQHKRLLALLRKIPNQLRQFNERVRRATPFLKLSLTLNYIAVRIAHFSCKICLWNLVRIISSIIFAMNIIAVF